MPAVAPEPASNSCAPDGVLPFQIRKKAIGKAGFGIELSVSIRDQIMGKLSSTLKAKYPRADIMVGSPYCYQRTSVLKGLFKRKTKAINRFSPSDAALFLIDAIDAFENRNYEEAIRRFNLLNEAYPDHPLTHLMLGRCLIELKRYEAAISEFYMHLKVVPNSVEATIYLGLAYYECDELALAQARFEEAMKLRASSYLAKENLIITKIAAGRFDDALTDLLALNKENPSDKSVVELLVLTLGKMGKWEAAKQYIHNNLGGAEVVTPA
jgi:Flp pilus assembly protein TadD